MGSSLIYAAALALIAVSAAALIIGLAESARGAVSVAGLSDLAALLLLGLGVLRSSARPSER